MAQEIPPREIEEWNKTRDFGLTYFNVAEYIEEEIGRQLKLHEAKACVDRIVAALQDTYADEIEDILLTFKKEKAIPPRAKARGILANKL